MCRRYVLFNRLYSAALASGIGNAEIQPNYYQYESEVMGGKMRLYWKLVDSTTVEVAVVSIGLGWVGFGLGTGICSFKAISLYKSRHD